MRGSKLFDISSRKIFDTVRSMSFVICQKLGMNICSGVERIYIVQVVDVSISGHGGTEQGLFGGSHDTTVRTYAQCPRTRFMSKPPLRYIRGVLRRSQVTQVESGQNLPTVWKQPSVPSLTKTANRDSGLCINMMKLENGISFIPNHAIREVVDAIKLCLDNSSTSGILSASLSINRNCEHFAETENSTTSVEILRCGPIALFWPSLKGVGTKPNISAVVAEHLFRLKQSRSYSFGLQFSPHLIAPCNSLIHSFVELSTFLLVESKCTHMET